MNKRAELVLSEVLSIWRFIGRDEHGRLLLFTHVPTTDDGALRVIRGASTSFEIVDNGIFDFIKPVTFQLISQHTFKNN